MILYCEFPKWKKGSVQCALQAFQAIALLSSHAPLLFSEYSNTDGGSEQYLDTNFGVMLSILGCNAVFL